MRENTNTRSQTRKAYAKINLTLEIFPPRPDGFHDVATVMHKTEIFDVVKVTLRDDLETHVNCSVPVCAEKDNLAYKAAKIFAEKRRISFGCDIDIIKNIPDKAGLAGGSADAAAVLDCLNDLFPHDDKKMGRELLHEAAASLGSDVPFCLGEFVCAKATGRGERIEPLLPLDETLCLIAVPGEGLSTKLVYGTYDQKGIFPPFLPGDKDSPTEKLVKKLCTENYRISDGDTFNSFEDLCCEKLPEIAILMQELCKTDAVTVRMSGSGSAVFALFDKHESAIAAIHKIDKLPFLRFLELSKTLRLS